MKIYILSLYEEHGAESVTATTDKSKVMKMAEGYEPRPEQVAKLAELLARDEPNPEAGINLGAGWGGLQLHIVESS